MIFNRTKNSKTNFLWGIMEKIIQIALPFVVRTVFLYKLGQEILGLNTLFASILQVLNLAELGFSSAIVYNMYKPIAEDDKKTLCALLNFYKKTYHIIGLIVIFGGLTLIPFLKLLIKGDIPDEYNLYILYLINLLSSGISYFLFAYKNSLISAYQREDIISKINIITNALTYTTQLIIIIAFKNYYVYLLALPTFTIINSIIKNFISKRMFPDIFCNGFLTNDQKRKIKKNITGLMIGKICIVSRNSFDSIFLSAFLGLVAVTIYGNYFYVFTAIVGVLAVVCNSIRASVGNRIATKTPEENYKQFKTFSFVYSWISGWCTSCLLCLYQPFMEIWVGAELMFPILTVVLICLYFYVLTLGDIRSIYSSATGLFWESRFYVVAEALINIVMNYILGKYFGVNGIVFATICGLFFINFIWGTIIIFKHYFKGIKPIRYFIQQLLCLTVTAFVCLASYLIVSFISLESYLGLIVKGAVCLLLPNILFLSLYFFFPEFKNCIPLIKQVLNNGK